MLAPCCEEPRPPSDAPKQRPNCPADLRLGFTQVSAQSPQQAGRARVPPRAVPLRPLGPLGLFGPFRSFGPLGSSSSELPT